MRLADAGHPDGNRAIPGPRLFEEAELVGGPPDVGALPFKGGRHAVVIEAAARIVAANGRQSAATAERSYRHVVERRRRTHAVHVTGDGEADFERVAKQLHVIFA